jgi:hypothetical protein
MLVVSVICFPLLLLGLMLSMERVERPLRDEAVGERVVALLASAHAEEVESLVSATAAGAVDRHWRRLRRRRAGLYVRRADDSA